MTNCNPNLCGTCRNQFNCQKYNAYIQSQYQSYNPKYTPTQPTQQTQDLSLISVDMNNIKNNSIDSDSLLQELSAFKDSMVDVVAARYLAIENQIKPFKNLENQIKPIDNQVKILTDSVNKILGTISDLNDKLVKLDSFIEMVEVANARNVASGNVDTGENDEQNGSLAVYTGEAESVKTLVEKTTKGFLGFGKKTEWVEEDKK